MTSNGERKVITVENNAGGKGPMTIEHLLGENELDGKCKMYAKVTIPVGSSLGYHEHHGNTETYFILSGTGEYSDNGEKYTVKAGDCTFCEEGNGHGLENIGDEDLVFMALIINK